MCFVVTCWERADLLALVCGVFCEFVTFPLVSWVRCGTWLYRFLIFAPLLTFCMSSWCLVIVVWLFLTIPWLCKQFVVVAFPEHTHYYFRVVLKSFIIRWKILQIHGKLQLHHLTLMQLQQHTQNTKSCGIPDMEDLVGWLVCCFTSMVMLGRSVHLATLFSCASLNKRLISTSCTYFRL